MENKFSLLFQNQFCKDIESNLNSIELIHVEAQKNIENLVKYFLDSEANPVCSWWTALNIINQGETAFVLLNQYLDDEFYLFLKNLHENKKEFSLFDSRTSENISVKINSNKGKLFLVGNKNQVNMDIPFVDYELLKYKIENSLFDSE